MKADYKKLLIACWFTLVIFYLFVIITGKTLVISSEYQKFENFCKWVDSHVLIKNIIKFITYYLNWVFAYHTIHKCKIFGYKPIQFTLWIFIFWLLKTLLINYTIANYIDFAVFGGLILTHIKRWKLGCMVCLYTLGVVILTSVIKGVFIVGLSFDSLSTLEGLIFCIDLYLMSIVLFLYIIEKERGKQNV